MGHQNCGAVDAVIQGQTYDIPELASLIQPSVDKAKTEEPQDLLQTSIKLNALNMLELLKTSTFVTKKLEAGEISLHAAYYQLETGKVEFL